MKKSITTLMGMSLVALSCMVIGCSDTSEVKTQKEVSGPGGTTTITDRREVKQSGDNPPPAGTTTPTPPKQ